MISPIANHTSAALVSKDRQSSRDADRVMVLVTDNLWSRLSGLNAKVFLYGFFHFFCKSASPSDVPHFLIPTLPPLAFLHVRTLALMQLPFDWTRWSRKVIGALLYFRNIICPIKEVTPRIRNAIFTNLNHHRRRSTWLYRLLNQLHVCLSRRAAALAAIARNTASNNIFPSSFATLSTRNNMVVCEFVHTKLLPTVLTLITVTSVHRDPGKFHWLLVSTKSIQQTNHCRHFDNKQL